MSKFFAIFELSENQIFKLFACKKHLAIFIQKSLFALFLQVTKYLLKQVQFSLKHTNIARIVDSS